MKKLPIFNDDQIEIPSLLIISKSEFSTNKQNLDISTKINPYKQHILGLKDCWGEDDKNKKFRSKSWDRAEKFLGKIIESSKIRVSKFPIPKILPVSDNSIDLSWKCKEFELLVNIPKNPKEHIEYSGEEFKLNNPEIDGHDTFDSVVKVLSAWLSKIL